MAIIHKATLTPSKAELLADWLPSQPWFTDDSAACLKPVGSFRLDDPAGEVGMEWMIAEVKPGVRYLVPLTYRGEPLPEGVGTLVGRMTHSTLGQRWAYDAATDPVFLVEAAQTISERGGAADVFRELPDGSREPVPTAVKVFSTGGSGRLLVERRPQPASEADLADGSGVMWIQLGDETPVVVARLR